MPLHRIILPPFASHNISSLSSTTSIRIYHCQPILSWQRSPKPIGYPGPSPRRAVSVVFVRHMGVLFVPACPHPAHLPCARVCLPDNLMIPAVAFLFSTMAWQNTPSLGESAQRPSGKPAHCCARSAPYHGVNWYPSASASTAAK